MSHMQFVQLRLACLLTSGTPLGTPTSQRSLACPLPVYAPPSSLAHGEPQGTTTVLLLKVAVCVTRRLYHCPRIPLLNRYRIPFLLARPVVCSCHVEEPVTLAGPDGVDLRHFGAVVKPELRCYDIWSGGVCHDEFGEGGAGGGVVLCASVINLHGFGEDAGGDGDRFAVLGIGDGAGE
jgi:hypothetical protein